MTPSRLINRNILTARGRTSMRLEPEFWAALAEICNRERISLRTLIERIEQSGYSGGRTSAVRVFVLEYFRKLAAKAKSGGNHKGNDPNPLAPELA